MNDSGRDQSRVPDETTTVFLPWAPGSVGGRGQLDDADAADLRVVGVRHRDLLAGGGLDHLAQPHDVAALVGRQLQAQRRRLDDGVEHPAPGDVDLDPADLRHLDRRVDLDREGRHVLEGDGGRPAVLAPRRGS